MNESSSHQSNKVFGRSSFDFRKPRGRKNFRGLWRHTWKKWKLNRFPNEKHNRCERVSFLSSTKVILIVPTVAFLPTLLLCIETMRLTADSIWKSSCDSKSKVQTRLHWNFLRSLRKIFTGGVFFCNRERRRGVEKGKWENEQERKPLNELIFT